VDVTLDGWTLGLGFGALVPVGDLADHDQRGHFELRGQLENTAYDLAVE